MSDLSEKSIQIYQKIQQAFTAILEQSQLSTDKILIQSRGLSPEEAIGTPNRTDYPILTGQEVMLMAEYDGAFGQAFTDAPSDYQGSLTEILSMDIMEDAHARGLYIASVNTVLRKLGSMEHTVHCKNEEPSECAAEYVGYLRQHYPNTKIALVGYQPFLFQEIAKYSDMPLRVLDLNPENVGKKRFGILVEHGMDDYESVVGDWADLLLCTSSVFTNGTMDKYVDIEKEVLFYGITGAGPVQLLNLKRHCPMSH